MTLQKSLLFKIFLSVIIAFVFLYVQPKNQLEIAEANANLEIAKKGASGVIGTVVALEVAKDMGWKMTKDAWSKITPKIKAIVEASYDAWDFTKSKPKKNGKQLEVDVSSLDKAKMATILKEIAEEVIEIDIDRKTKNVKNLIDMDVQSSEPLYSTSVEFDLFAYSNSSSADLKGLDFITRMFDYKFTPQAYKKTVKLEITPIYTPSLIAFSYDLPGGTYNNPKKYSFGASEAWDGRSMYLLRLWGSDTKPLVDLTYNYYYTSSSLEAKAFEMYLRALESSNSVYYFGQGIAVPENNKKIYDIPINTPSTYKLPGDLAKTGGKLLIPFPNADDSVIDIDFELLENDYELTNNVQNFYSTVFDNDASYSFTTNNFIVNNYYTIEQGEKPQEEIDEEIKDVVVVPPGGGEVAKPIDNTLLSYVKNAYEYATDTIMVSVNGLKSLAAGAIGIISLYTVYMGFLPEPVVLTLTSGLGILIGLRIFRR